MTKIKYAVMLSLQQGASQSYRQYLMLILRYHKILWTQLIVICQEIYVRDSRKSWDVFIYSHPQYLAEWLYGSMEGVGIDDCGWHGGDQGSILADVPQDLEQMIERDYSGDY